MFKEEKFIDKREAELIIKIEEGTKVLLGPKSELYVEYGENKILIKEDGFVVLIKDKFLPKLVKCTDEGLVYFNLMEKEV